MSYYYSVIQTDSTTPVRVGFLHMKEKNENGVIVVTPKGAYIVQRGRDSNLESYMLCDPDLQLGHWAKQYGDSVPEKVRKMLAPQ